VRILATSSSSLGASARFRDTLAGRKHELWLTPMITEDLGYFSNPSIEHRLLRGGLPPFFLAEANPEKEYQEWLDAYWAKDILELFRLERRFSFMRFAELLFAQSGGIFEASRFATACEDSRTTIANYLSVLEATYVVHLLRPFSTHRSTEIVSAPKVYGFDTGFVCSHKGWTSLRSEDLGLLWEHFVLNELQAKLQTRKIHYWRDKSGHEVDLVLAHPSNRLTAVEAKWAAASFDPSSLIAMRRKYPDGSNFAVCQDTRKRYTRGFQDIRVQFVNLDDLTAELAIHPA
jgi:predicted AAA+ superfamily ATPase